MEGKIYPPCSDLSPFVRCYWTLDFRKEQSPSLNTIVPDGTIKMIFHYGDLYWHHPTDSDPFLQPRCFIIGQLTRPYIVEPDGDTGTFVVRFHPNGFLPFTTLPLKDLENKPVPLSTIYGETGKILENQILEAQDTETRICLIESFLLEMLRQEDTIDRIVQETVNTLLSVHGQISVTELSEQNQTSRRQLARKFSKSIGLSPKQLSKTIRLQATLKSLLNQDKPKLTDLAYEGDYYDQSHFIKDFKEFTGLSPKAFYGEKLKMSLLFDQKK